MNAKAIVKIRNGGDDAELFIYEPIGADFYGGISATQVKNELRAAKNAKNLSIRINSPGGDVFDSYTILNLLKEHPATKSVSIDGLAASGASLIAMAGDTVTMAPASMMMIHEASAGAYGRAADLRALADVLDKLNGQLAGIYGERTGLDAETIAEMLNAETWLTAEEAVDQGFADSINEQAQRAAAFIDPNVFKNYKRIPEAFAKPLTPMDQLALNRLAINAEKARRLTMN